MENLERGHMYIKIQELKSLGLKISFFADCFVI